MPRLNAAEEHAASRPLAAPPKARHSARISENEHGQLTISEAGARKIAKTFLGSNTHSDPDLESLENTLFAQAAGALPYGRGKCGTPEALNFALDAVASLAPRDGLEVMLSSALSRSDPPVLTRSDPPAR
jgi:hypothetical protein